ncbi:hypothetical protein F9288_06290 [Sphingomonas sp. CL5.1]|uniref:DUF7508 domain-containing protein n=1 Tax=Sphingomonas sp. CL5.1 TaxID=2653203 RepID=UPI001581CC69|nr:hypothetical protein [Sphingomonas sp. CL5.1]QKR99295.1 hypothetical protein F9288_06290 [Sphingomonas sp. CL5.1]
MSGLGIREAWRPFNQEAISELSAVLGVYEIGNSTGETLRIGYAGGRSLFGLRSELVDLLNASVPDGCCFRVECNMQYMSRWKELLMDHVARHGSIPPLNPPEDATNIGQLGQRVRGEQL